jgi:WD40 repeat protein
VWDLDHGRQVTSLDVPGLHWVRGLAALPDGNRIVSGLDDGQVIIWDLRSGQEIHRFLNHSRAVNDVAVTARGNRVLSASDDGTVKISDFGGLDLHFQRLMKRLISRRTRPKVLTLNGHTGRVWAVAVTGSGDRAVSASDDRTLKVWDLQTSHVVATFTADAALLCCAMATAGTTIVAGDASGSIHFLELIPP